MSDLSLREQCSQFFQGHKRLSPTQIFAAMSTWCAEHQIKSDWYGEGQLVQDFETRVAHLCGYQAGLFFVTGTMTQQIALRLACEDSGCDQVAMHSSAHIALHEKSNYQLLRQFSVLTVGEAYRPWLAQDLRALPDRLGAALYELPMREIGGQLPGWQELEEIKAECAQRGLHLHLDGARLWEAAAGYGRPLAEVCHGFASAYVSFYKGINGMGGAMLLGSQDFIARAKPWLRRMGGNIAQRLPYVVWARMQFEERLAAMPACVEKAREFARICATVPGFQINPQVPHCNLLHWYMPGTPAQCEQARDMVAQEEKAWLFAQVENTALPNMAMTEVYVGDNMLALDAERIGVLLSKLEQYLRLIRQQG